MNKLYTKGLNVTVPADKNCYSPKNITDRNINNFIEDQFKTVTGCVVDYKVSKYPNTTNLTNTYVIKDNIIILTESEYNKLKDGI